MSVDDLRPPGSARHEKQTSTAKSSRKRHHAEVEQTSPNILEMSSNKKARNSSATVKQTSKMGLSNTQPASPFVVQRTAFYLPLSPIAQAAPLAGLCAEHLSPLLLTYHPPLRGVVLSYSDPVLSSTPPPDLSSGSASQQQPALARSIDEYGTPFIWLSATFLILRPMRNATFAGYVSVVNESHLGLICYNLFNASIERRYLPHDWNWINTSTKANSNSKLGGMEQVAEGHFVDGQGNMVDGLVEFRIRDFENIGHGIGSREKRFLTMQGTLLSEEEEGGLEMSTKRADQEAKRRKTPGPQLGKAAHDHDETQQHVVKAKKRKDRRSSKEEV